MFSSENFDNSFYETNIELDSIAFISYSEFLFADKEKNFERTESESISLERQLFLR